VQYRKDYYISKRQNILNNFNIQVDKNRSGFSNYNIIRMREAVRYLTPDKLEIFIKIPFLLHINFPKYPGFTGVKALSHGIWNFENSGFYKEVVQKKLFPKFIIESSRIEKPAILGLYHIGSLGTFTQSTGSDFDYWVIIDKKKFSQERYNNLEKKLDAILNYSRESYDQKVSFFIMDQKDIKNNCYASFNGEETLTAPKIFLKEEFYRTFLMIAGKIPVWSVLPPVQDLKTDNAMNQDGIIAQILSINDDFIDLGQIDLIPFEDILKGLLWHICKSRSDPVKAIIKATMLFSYGFARNLNQILLCENIKQGYANAGIDDYGVDPYKVLFDRILEFHEKEEPKMLNLIKNAIFFRLCEYPDVKLPDVGTPKRRLLDKYIRAWKLNKNQVEKLLSYATWSESEKLLLEKTFINRIASMYNHAVKKKNRAKPLVYEGVKKRNWTILRNKTKERLKKAPNKISECSTYLKHINILRFCITKKSKVWALTVLTESGKEISLFNKQPHFLNIFGWILENQLYLRQKAEITIKADLELFESVDQPIDMDSVYMAFQPLKPLSDDSYEQDALWSKMIIFLFYEQNILIKAEFLIANTWGELFLETIEFSGKIEQKEQYSQISNLMFKYSGHDSNQVLRFYIYQFSSTRDSNIVYELKKAYSDINEQKRKTVNIRKKPYLDKL